MVFISHQGSNLLDKRIHLGATTLDLVHLILKIRPISSAKNHSLLAWCLDMSGDSCVKLSRKWDVGGWLEKDEPLDLLLYIPQTDHVIEAAKLRRSCASERDKCCCPHVRLIVVP